ncbi:hypothetical protein C791_3580 [Amycolatopsis azurea DSM 43854]|uniref:Uncharacterized protein n=1 Tax=Amycolatopsis azurea DSM 43854 TaxID=1238180 RepID=M2QIF1_9PSEU|nr:hypothetical protein C791_3580 [Amycolatopsis azurea DSM 43854]
MEHKEKHWARVSRKPLSQPSTSRKWLSRHARGRAGREIRRAGWVVSGK